MWHPPQWRLFKAASVLQLSFLLQSGDADAHVFHGGPGTHPGLGLDATWAAQGSFKLKPALSRADPKQA